MASPANQMMKPKNFDKNIPLPRSHSVIDHNENGLKNFLTVCGGSLTTHRSMAEDVVNKPKHYNQYGIECIDSIRASMSQEAFRGYLKGNVEKYLWRYNYKSKPVEDLQKAQWYLNKLIEEVSNDD